MRLLIRIVICRTLILGPPTVDVPFCYALLFAITPFCLIVMLECSAGIGMDDVDGRYYEGGVSSVYMWDLDDGIAGVVLFKKSILPQDLSSRDLLPESFQ